MKEVTKITSATLGKKRERRAVNTPLERGSTVLMENAHSLYQDEIKPGYGTDGLSTQKELARLVAQLEGAYQTFLLPTGLSALTLPLFTFLNSGDEILLSVGCYAPVRRFLNQELSRFGIRSINYDPLSPIDEIMGLATPRTRMIYIEAPSSLTMEVCDIAALAKAARAKGLLSLMDNTYGAGVLFKPLAAGVDLSMQALTKYVGGHSDLLIGALSVSDERLAKRLYEANRALGFFASADEAYLAIRGMKTLHLRLDHSSRSSIKIANYLSQRPEVSDVYHPALQSHPHYDSFKAQFSGSNGLFSVRFHAQGSEAERIARSEAFLDSLELFGLGFSWGGFESLAIHCEPQLRHRPKSNKNPDEAKAHQGCFIRFYIGLEDPDDLTSDIEQALVVFRT
jgi:cysteine-S-conjugate beta-lyase